MGIVFSTPSSHLDDLAAFVTASPTSYHAASSMASRLADTEKFLRLVRGVVEE